MKEKTRREFLKKGSLAFAATGILGACSSENSKSSPSAISNQNYEWRMVTTWPPHYPILGEGADRFAKVVGEMSNGRLKIQVYGGGELVPSLEVFDAVSQGVAECGHGASYYWAGKAPATQFFTSIPFGMDAEQTYAWLNFGGGMELWKELYLQFNLVPFPCGNTGKQMGGWYNRKIESVSDLQGLKIRIPGIGAKIINKSGGTAVLSAAGEIYTNLERGVIDATEWIGPYHDWLMGFHKIAKYYYYPSFSEKQGVMELIINKSAFESLPADLQQIVAIAAEHENLKMLTEFNTKNSEYLQKMKTESDAEIIRFPEEVWRSFQKYAGESVEEIAESDAFSRKVYDSYSSFMKKISGWSELV
ncbi:MAG: TRAP transporter substrate-binding protein [Melioribacteraceae bacterium]|nr:TRAP transporter substrate-binding protein [Melioribacteraceae bacterium]MCF8431531.1 TRAP transporter substrate-binding protein [Melioribacteraceae bacterium]